MTNPALLRFFFRLTKETIEYTDIVSAAQFVFSPLWEIKLFTRKVNVINSIEPKIQDQVGI